MKIFLKDNICWTILSFAQNFLKGQSSLNHALFMSKFSQKTRWVESYCILLRIFLKNIQLDYIVFWWKLFKKTILLEPCCLLVKTFFEDYTDWRVLSSGQNLLKRKRGLNHIVLRSNFSLNTLVEPFCLLVKIFLKDYMGWNLLSSAQNFLRGLYGLNRIIFSPKLW